MAAGDELLDLSGNRLLDAAGRIMLSTGTNSCSCCCSCTCGDTTLPLACSLFKPTGCTPRVVEVVLSGIVTHCGQDSASTSSDVSGATMSGTYNLTAFSACEWLYTELSPGTTYFFRNYGFSTTCTGSPTGTSWSIQVFIQDQSAYGRGVVVLCIIGGSGSRSGFDVFAGQTSLGDCALGTSYVLNNGTGYDGSSLFPNDLIFLPGGTGGTVTVTFCP